MTFKCNSCNESISDSKMAGIAIGHISRSVLESKSISSQASLASAFSKGEFAAGVLSGFGVPCPKCNKSNWS